jgi:type IV pilus assembly protein PilC
MYPVVLAYVLAVPVSFTMIVIMPKFKDIFDQLGAELPPVTQTLIRAFQFFSFPHAVASALAGLILLFFIIRALMNGNFMSRVLITFGFIALGEPLFLAMMPLLLEYNERHGVAEWAPVLSLIFVLLTLALLFIILPKLVGWLEGVVLYFERSLEPLLRHLPFIGEAARTEAESRWLAAFSTQIEAGVTPPEAIEQAGRICGGALAHRSRQAAEIVRQGRDIGQALVECRPLRPQVNHRMALLDGSPDYLAGVRAIAEDASAQAFEVLYRTSRLAEVVGLLLLGVVMFGIVLALYMPLFSIPGIVARVP